MARKRTGKPQSMTQDQINRLNNNSSMIASLKGKDERRGKSAAMRKSGGKPPKVAKISKISQSSSEDGADDVEEAAND